MLQHAKSNMVIDCSRLRFVCVPNNDLRPQQFLENIALCTQILQNHISSSQQIWKRVGHQSRLIPLAQTCQDMEHRWLCQQGLRIQPCSLGTLGRWRADALRVCFLTQVNFNPETRQGPILSAHQAYGNIFRLRLDFFHGQLSHGSS